MPFNEFGFQEVEYQKLYRQFAAPFLVEGNVEPVFHSRGAAEPLLWSHARARHPADPQKQWRSGRC